MSTTPTSTFTDSEQLIPDLQRQLDECRAERAEARDHRAAGHALPLDGGGPGWG
jgi:hypothetical protein